MRVGQTSFIVFIAKLLGSVLGFIATLTFARLLGAEIIGYYSIILAVVSWLKLGGNLGISGAVSKRISEDQDPNQHFTAGIITIAGFAAVITFAVVVLRDFIDAYVGVDAWHYVIPLLLTGLTITTFSSALRGERKVHLAGVLTPTNVAVTSLTQIGLVLAGFGLTGMLVGYFIGELVVSLVGATLVSVGIRRPNREHFERLYDFAKFSWLGNLKLQSFNNVDIIVLGALVPSSLVGIYAVAWSISKFLTLFGHAVRNTIFPEISHADASGDTELISKLTTDSLAFIGLIAIPGMFGGVVLGDRILQIYGDEFTRGAVVLAILISATLIYSYQQQMLSIINGLDRPDVAFRINAVFIGLNVVLNIALVIWIGWLGAAIATAFSALIGLVLAFRILRSLIEFELPLRELSHQVGAAALMSIVVLGTRHFLEATDLVDHNALMVVGLVVLGAAIYFLSLIAISERFREILDKNAPLPIPL